jgi:hypothetical protein
MEVVSAGTYFQGKSRIPVPVRVTRYSGDTDIETLTSDLVALTKMGWNTFALYRKLPVTVTTPNVAATIGQVTSGGHSRVVRLSVVHVRRGDNCPRPLASR